MKRIILLTSTLLVCVAFLIAAAAEVSPTRGSADVPADERVRFRITAVEERGLAGREIISDAVVEGPPGTDFNVNLQDERFRMVARFMTDLGTGGGLTLRAKLDTRRLYGYSEAGLPLYEEDAQRHTLNLNFDEAVVLLPFGGGNWEGRLSIEIKPERSGRPSRLPTGESTAPEITIGKPSSGGAISIEATKVPHDFNVEAALLVDGREVARGAAACLLEESSRMVLRPSGAAVENGAVLPLALNLKVERYETGTGNGRAAVRFDLFDDDPERPGDFRPLARNWAGVANLGSELTYDLSQLYGATSGRKYELRLSIDLAPANAVGR
jgi:hypothetical protein